MSLRIWLTIAALTAVAVVLVLVPIYRVSDSVIYAVVIADFIAIGLIARDTRAPAHATRRLPQALPGVLRARYVRRDARSAR